jgi:hypothetical protein
MSASGAPARFTLSSTDHGLDVTHAGATLTGPGERWGLRAWSAIPFSDDAWVQRYGGAQPNHFFLWQESEQPPSLQLLGTAWVTLKGKAHVFFVQPRGWKPEDQASLELADLVKGQLHRRKDLIVGQAWSEAAAYADERRFRLDGLDGRQRYRVTSAEVKGQKSAPVVVVLSAAPDEHYKFGDGQPHYQGSGPPWQVLLRPKETVEVWGANGLDVVVPRFPGDEERRVEVSVTSLGAPIVIERGSAEARALTPKDLPQVAMPPPRDDAMPSRRTPTAPTPRDESMSPTYCRDQGTLLLASGKPDDAIVYFKRCLVLDPGNPDCEVLLRRAELKVRH